MPELSPPVASDADEEDDQGDLEPVTSDTFVANTHQTTFVSVPTPPLRVDLSLLPHFDIDPDKCRDFFQSIRLMMNSQPSYSSGSDALVTTQANKGRSHNLNQLIWSRVLSCPSAKAFVRSPPQSTFLDNGLGFELLASLMKEYGDKVEGVYLFRNLMLLFQETQGDSDLDVFVGNLQRHLNNLQAGGMTIPSMMETLFFFMGLSPDYGRVQEDFALHSDAYMGATLSQLKLKAQTFGAVKNLPMFPSVTKDKDATRASSTLVKRPLSNDGLKKSPAKRTRMEIQHVVEAAVKGSFCPICKSPTHGLMNRPCMALLSQGIICVEDHAKAKAMLDSIREKRPAKQGDDEHAIRAAAAWILDGDDEFVPDDWA